MLNHCHSNVLRYKWDCHRLNMSLRPAQHTCLSVQRQELHRLALRDTGRCSAQLSHSLQRTEVVEYLLLLQAPDEADPEAIEALLDSLWSIQYMVPSVLYAAAGKVTQCSMCNSGGTAASRSSQKQHTSTQLPVAPEKTIHYTHAVHFRLTDRLALEGLKKHQVMSQAMDQVRQLCCCSAQVMFLGSIAQELEAIFRRGEEYATGIEHILLLQQSIEGLSGAATFLQKLGELAESPVAGGIQASHGAVVSSVNSMATHVFMTRFTAQKQVQSFLQSPACAAILQQDPRLPVTAVASLCMSVQPAEESTTVGGISEMRL